MKMMRSRFSVSAGFTHLSRRAVVACTTLCACLGLLAAAATPAVAGKTYKTTIASLVRGEEGIEGKISSPKAACLGHRVVRGELFGTYGAVPLGEVRTDGSGKLAYELDFENMPSHFMVEVFVTSKALGGGALCEAKRLKKVFG